jgi:hypothetical protein
MALLAAAPSTIIAEIKSLPFLLQIAVEYEVQTDAAIMSDIFK